MTSELTKQARNFHPVLFSTPMVQAIMEGRKTMTRRVIKDAQIIACLDAGILKGAEKLCPYGKAGDVLWVRETFVEGVEMKEDYYVHDEAGNYISKIFYRADKNIDRWFDGDKYVYAPKWKPSIHMPKTSCRIFLEITDVRVERLQDINEEDAIKEGVLLHERGVHWLNYVDQKHGLTQFIYNYRSAKDSFKSLWQVINGPISLIANPWVWIIEFKRINKPENFK